MFSRILDFTDLSILAEEKTQKEIKKLHQRLDELENRGENKNYDATETKRNAADFGDDIESES